MGQWDEVYMTQSIGPVGTGYSIQFSYRIVQDNNYPGTASVLRDGDSINVEISVDNGPWILLETIDSTNHIPSTSFLTKTYSLSSYAGSGIRLHLYSSGGREAQQNNYWIDVDDIKVTGNYCIPGLTHGTTYQWDYNISHVHINNFSESFVNYITDPYVDVTETTHDLNLRRGDNYKLYLTSGIATGNHFAAWIDYNADGDFSDAGEKLGEYINTTGYAMDSISFTVPTNASFIHSRLRVRCSMQVSGLLPCADDDYGQVIDISLYMIDYCIPLASPNASPQFVMDYASVDHSSNLSLPNPPFGYVYFIAAPVDAFDNCFTHTIKTVCTPANQSISTTAAWIDFNNDDDFDDAGEKLGQALAAPYDTATINFLLPATVANGGYTMRIRAQDGNIANLTPCPDDFNSETNDIPVIINLNYPAVSITGNTVICNGSSTTLSATSGYPGYLWSDGSPQSSINVSPSTTTVYSVTAMNAIGCTASASTTVTVNPILVPAAAILNNGSDSLCAGSATTFSATSMNGGVTPLYTWLLDGVTVATGASYPFTATVPGTFQVECIVHSSETCADPDSGISPAHSISVFEIPQQPVLSTNAAGDSVISSVTDPDYEYTWLLDGQLISSGSQATVGCSGSGNYSLVISNRGCVSDTSAVLTIICAGIKIPDISTFATVFPNPFHDVLRLEFHQQAISDLYIRITDQLSKIVSEERLTNSTAFHTLEVSSLSSGIYFLQIQVPDDGTNYRMKIVKQ